MPTVQKTEISHKIISLTDSIHTVLPQFAKPLASRLGESEEAVECGMRTAAAAMIHTTSNRVSDPGFMSHLMQLVKNSSQWAEKGPVIEATDSQMDGASLLCSLFGLDHSAPIRMVAFTAGLRSSSASAVWSSTAPILLSVLAERVRKDNLRLESVYKLLVAEGEKVHSLLPTFSNPTLSAKPV